MIFLNFLIAFALIVFVHELGHFLAAKAVGMRVETFSVGFGPRLTGKVFGGTDYRISLIPLGGYVKMSSEGHSAKPIWQRIFVSLAGPLANLCFALAILVGLYAVGVPSLTSRIGNLQPDKPAILSGVMRGDRVVAVNGSDVKFWNELTDAIGRSKPGTDIRLDLRRGDQALVVFVRPETRGGKPFIGIAPSDESVTQYFGMAASLKLGSQRWWREIKSFVGFVSGFVTGASSAKEIGGPMAIASVANKAAQSGVGAFILVIAILSVSLGMFNLLPLPILDGGTVLLYLYEGIVGRPIPSGVLLRLNQAGIMALSLLMAWACLNDLGR